MTEWYIGTENKCGLAAEFVLMGAGRHMAQLDVSVWKREMVWRRGDHADLASELAIAFYAEN